MTVNLLRVELKARNTNSKGIKSQLVARLAKALKSEAEKAEDSFKDNPSDSETEVAEDKKTDVIILIYLDF